MGASCEMRLQCSPRLVGHFIHEKGASSQHYDALHDCTAYAEADIELALAHKQEAKWRDQFKKLGREAVRDKLHAGVYWRTRQGAVAERWLREQEAAEDSANKWVRAATIAGVVIALFSLLMMFG